ncbi:hypothetical protein QBC41DRAFT_373823 [Cercophora samala]|uniref:Uncharacterized protein n=1 Tax=Cercophora samala TaxID=330535 RepID=A0AA39ZCY6_9PEZI|nr:hypothetical protein QBC41DRAFT_373823 [Cercophora samala]
MYHRLRLMTSLDSPPSPKSQGISTALETMHEEPESIHSGHRSPVMSGGTGPPSAFDMREEDRRRRRSSTFSGYSWSEAGRDLHDEILDPGPFIRSSEASWRTTLPIVFAILPATVGLVFKNGSSFVTDVILLGLAAVFLHWSVTAPWKWYHASQQIREEEEESVVENAAFRDEGGSGDDAGVDHQETDVNSDEQQQQQQQQQEQPPPQPDPQTNKMDRRAKIAEQALTQLRRLEAVALLTCFIAPALATWMLHYIRDLLSRDSEGLVSNFNLVIFLLAAEISPLSHIIKLIQAKTWSLQRLVHSHSNPYRQEKVTLNQWRELIARLDELETRGLTNAATTASVSTSTSTNIGPSSPVEAGAASGNGNGKAVVVDTRQVHASLVREVRNQIQPEIDALNRAVRRYEKKARVLAVQTEGRLRDLGQRVDDAISLSAVVAGRGNKGTEWDLVGWCLEGAVWVLMLPVRGVVRGLAKGLGGVGWLMGVKEVEERVHFTGEKSKREMDGLGERNKGGERWQRGSGGSGSGSGGGGGGSGGKGYLGRRR